MAEKREIHDQKSHCSVYNQHLCYLASQGFDRSDPDEYLSLMSEPAFMCETCKRVANSVDNLCRPVSL